MFGRERREEGSSISSISESISLLSKQLDLGAQGAQDRVEQALRGNSVLDTERRMKRS